MARNKERRCAGCGGLIEPGTKVIRVQDGIAEDGGAFTERSVQAELHPPCYVNAVDSPALVLAQLRRISKQELA